MDKSGRFEIEKALAVTVVLDEELLSLSLLFANGLKTGRARAEWCRFIRERRDGGTYSMPTWTTMLKTSTDQEFGL